MGDLIIGLGEEVYKMNVEHFFFLVPERKNSKNKHTVLGQVDQVHSQTRAHTRN